MRLVPQASSLRRPPVQRRSAERLSRILDACADLLDEGGYDTLSTRAVALRAGVPIGSVYRFFDNKRAMVDALAERNLERYTERVTRRLARTDGEGGWRAAMDAVLDEYVDMRRTAPGFGLVDFGNQIPVGARAEPNRRVTDRLTDLLSAYLDGTPDDDLRRMFLIAVETADTLVHLAFRMDPEGDPKVIEETRTLLHGYLGRVLT
ncbi:TetR family transcriptional regulator [Streptomyces sp. RY43-2]|uniref:TetR family transcriptional regulator n=1 Tax=Streptomyces macrolidinus TaxID=2952607 RepID=A0ABT0ZK67_9ACTN|nr:TetR/AcrR family transcriptional regulator [Streptomyces macrolidinus]MCN9243915.1 TetR family transcriptional regulator [Streptomyces macrolidinus]